ncbi:MAG: hypothetical protein JF606_23860 [Burkholderiales bacterium]|nr:hypothetical protein [Burkholderiales bacterium]
MKYKRKACSLTPALLAIVAMLEPGCKKAVEAIKSPPLTSVRAGVASFIWLRMSAGEIEDVFPRFFLLGRGAASNEI